MLQSNLPLLEINISAVITPGLLTIKDLSKHRQIEKLRNKFLKGKNTQDTISFIILREFSMVCQIFVSPQVKRWAIITYKHCIYELPHELPNNLRLRILGN